jgi:hypothetical protein
MKTSLARRLDRANHGARPAEKEEDVDTSGMSPSEIVLHAMKRHGLAKLLDMVPRDDEYDDD